MAADRLPPLSEEQMTAEQRAAAAEISSGPRGAVIGPFAPLLRSPELMTRLQKVGEYLRFESPLDRRLFEMTILYVARWWDQQFEWTFHHPLALEAGLDPAVADAIAEALDGPEHIYLSIDIDVIDPGLAPGTGTPEPGGMLTRELLRAVRQIVAAVDLVGMDVVEVSPPYDHAETTAMAANRLALEAISALAAKRKAGTWVRRT